MNKLCLRVTTTVEPLTKTELRMAHLFGWSVEQLIAKDVTTCYLPLSHSEDMELDLSNKTAGDVVLQEEEITVRLVEYTKNTPYKLFMFVYFILGLETSIQWAISCFIHNVKHEFLYRVAMRRLRKH